MATLLLMTRFWMKWPQQMSLEQFCRAEHCTILSRNKSHGCYHHIIGYILRLDQAGLIKSFRMHRKKNSLPNIYTHLSLLVIKAHNSWSLFTVSVFIFSPLSLDVPSTSVFILLWTVFAIFDKWSILNILFLH